MSTFTLVGVLLALVFIALLFQTRPNTIAVDNSTSENPDAHPTSDNSGSVSIQDLVGTYSVGDTTTQLRADGTLTPWTRMTTTQSGTVSWNGSQWVITLNAWAANGGNPDDPDASIALPLTVTRTRLQALTMVFTRL